MALNRNFRTTYYKTLGVPVVQHIVDVEASYHALFAEPVLNVTQLMTLALEVGISPTYRAPAWKVLCSVLPVYKCLWDFADHERGAMYADLVEAASVLQLPDMHVLDVSSPENTVADTDPIQTDRDARPSDAITSSTKLIALYKTYRNDVLALKPSDGSVYDDDRLLRGIIAVLQTVLRASVVDQFWCLVRIMDVLEDALEFLDPVVTVDAFYDITVAEFETYFVRALEWLRGTSRT